MDISLEKIKKQHEDSYKNALLETIENNTNVLVDEDIKSLLKAPPLDSMDSIKNKFLSLAKKNKVVLNLDDLSKITNSYRKYTLKCCSEIKKIRYNSLSEKINGFNFDKSNDVIKINKKDFIDINKRIKKIIKNYLLTAFNNYIENKIRLLFNGKCDEEKIDKIYNDITKFIKGSYQKQIIENLEIKILVKDTTLINSSKEHAERYLFALHNSRLLNDLN